MSEMSSDTAKQIIASVVQRLTSDGARFRIAEGVLSEIEVRALSVLSGVEMPIIQNAPSKPSVNLDISATTLVPFPESELRLCLDFGTAMSKAWATADRFEATIPLVLGQEANGSDTLAVPSAIFIAGNRRIYFGTNAEIQHQAEMAPGRSLFENIKGLLSDVEPQLDIDAVPLDAGVDPTVSGLTKGDLLVLYLAWLTHISLASLNAALARMPKLSGRIKDVRAVCKRFAIPCFEHAADDARSKVRAEWAEMVMRSSLKRAQIVADTLAGKWENLTSDQAKSVLDQVKAQESTLKSLDAFFAKKSSIREPVAAGATRIADFFSTQEVGETKVRRFMLVVDAGAGTTDFAMFQTVFDPGKESTSFSLISNAVRMSRIAGNLYDSALRPLVLKACQINPENGAPRTPNEFSVINADLSAQIRELKRRIFSSGDAAISLRPGASGKLTLNQVEQDQRYRELGENLLKLREEILQSVFTQENIDYFRSINARTGRSVPISVLLTGGSAALPAIQALAVGRLVIEGVRFEFKKIDDLPRWVIELPRAQSALVAREFAQCAVAIGGSAPSMPNEYRDLSTPATPGPDGVRTIGRFQISGT